MTQKFELPDELLDLVSGGRLSLGGNTVDAMSLAHSVNGDVTIRVHTADGHFRMTISPIKGQSQNVFTHWSTTMMSLLTDKSTHCSLDAYGFEKYDEPHPMVTTFR